VPGDRLTYPVFPGDHGGQAFPANVPNSGAGQRRSAAAPVPSGAKDPVDPSPATYGKAGARLSALTRRDHALRPSGVSLGRIPFRGSGSRCPAEEVSWGRPLRKVPEAGSTGFCGRRPPSEVRCRAKDERNEADDTFSAACDRKQASDETRRRRDGRLPRR
jgi:hypothetical protein